MRSWASSLLSLSMIVVAVVGCSSTHRTEQQRVSSPPEVLPVPDAVLAVISVPALDQFLDGAQDLAERAKQGMAGARPQVEEELAGMVGLRSFHDFDPRRPVHVILVTTPDGRTPIAVAAVVATRDPHMADEILAAVGPSRYVFEDGWAVVGPVEVLPQLSPWALHTLARMPAPPGPHFTIEPRALGRTIEAAIGAGTARDVVGSLDAVEGSFTITGEGVTLDASVTARAGSTLATVLAAQRPASFAMLDRIPDDHADFIAGGRLNLEPLRDRIRSLLTSLLPVGEMPPELVDAALDAFAGEFGTHQARMGSDPMGSQTFLFELAADKVDRQRAMWKDMVALVIRQGRAGADMTIADDPAHDGVVMTAALHAAAPVGARWGAWDGLFGVVVGLDTLERAHALIDGTRHRKWLLEALAHAIAASKRRHDSVLVFVALADVWAGEAKVVPPAVAHFLVLALGAAGGRLNVHLDLPAVVLVDCVQVYDQTLR